VRPGETLPSALRAAEVLGPDGPRRLGDLLRGPTLLVFLREFGCPHCAHQVDQIMARLPELESLGVGVVLVGNGPPEALVPFARRMQLEGRRVTVVTDPSRASFRAAALRRPRKYGWWTVPETLRVFGAGYRQRRRAGDAWQLGGAFLVDDAGRVVYHHRSETPGDLADPSDIVQAALALVIERRAAGRLV
jgi:peroxiredoxin